MGPENADYHLFDMGTAFQLLHQSENAYTFLIITAGGKLIFQLHVYMLKAKIDSNETNGLR